MLEQLTNTAENIIYGYQPDEFLPVFRDGELENTAAFVAYKAEKVLRGLGHFVYKSIEATGNVVEEIQASMN